MAVAPPDIQDTTFGNTKNYYESDWPKHLLVPIGCKEKYKSHHNWGRFAIIEETEF